MSKTICIDAGHYGKYNQSPANKKYYESDVMWKLHLLQKKYLEQYGAEVLLTRENQETDKKLYDRGAMSKGCDLFISDHSNAVGSGVNESVDYPVVYVPLSGNGDVLGQKLADCIAKTMGTKQSGRISKRKSSSGGEYYGVIRGAVAVGTVGMIIEHSFHTNTRSTNWLLNDDNLDKLARAEAKVIAEHYGLNTSASSKRLTVDGLWGKDTTTMTQHVLGTPEDGIVSKQIAKLKEYLPNAVESSWEFKEDEYKGGSMLIQAIQELVGVEVDGHCGKDTVTAMQEFLKNKGLYSMSVDGIMGAGTVRGWQSYINSRLFLDNILKS